MTNADQQFWDEAAPKYATATISHMEGYTYTLERTRSYLGAQDRVLEIGCGTGSTALELAAPVARYLGTDLSQKMIDIARGKAAETDLNALTFEVADTHGALATEGAFSRVLAFNILHLIDDIPKALRGAHNALEPGGLLITKTPCLGSDKLWIRLLVRFGLPLMRLARKAPKHVQVFTITELERMVEDADFEIIETGGHADKPAHHYIVARKR